MPDFLPQRQSELCAWARSFVHIAGQNAPRYGLMEDDVRCLAQVVDQFVRALAIVTNPTTRTPTAMTEKTLARAAMLHALRPMAARVRANLGVSPADKQALGLRLPSLRRTFTPAPVGAPVIHIQGLDILAHTLCYHDQNGMTTVAKPPGATGLQLLCALGERPARLDQGQLVGVITRQPYTVRHRQDAAGQRAWYWGRWQTATGKVGPWSAPTSMLVAA